MSMRLEMLQVARLAPKLLGESIDLVIGFLRSQQNVDGGFNPTFQALFPTIETLTDAERGPVVFAYVPPTLLLGLQADSAFWFVVNPTSAETHTLSMAYIFPPSTLEHPLFGQLLTAAVAGVSLFNNQDLPTNTAIQRGLHSRYAPRGHYSTGSSQSGRISRVISRSSCRSSSWVGRPQYQ